MVERSARKERDLGLSINGKSRLNLSSLPPRNRMSSLETAIQCSAFPWRTALTSGVRAGAVPVLSVSLLLWQAPARASADSWAPAGLCGLHRLCLRFCSKTPGLSLRRYQRYLAHGLFILIDLHFLLLFHTHIFIGAI